MSSKALHWRDLIKNNEPTVLTINVENNASYYIISDPSDINIDMSYNLNIPDINNDTVINFKMKFKDEIFIEKCNNKKIIMDRDILINSNKYNFTVMKKKNKLIILGRK